MSNRSHFLMRLPWEAWWAAPVTVEAEVHIKGIRLDKEICSPSDEVAVEVNGAKVLQAFRSDDERMSVVDVETELQPNSTTEIAARPRGKS